MNEFISNTDLNFSLSHVFQIKSTLKRENKRKPFTYLPGIPRKRILNCQKKFTGNTFQVYIVDTFKVLALLSLLSACVQDHSLVSLFFFSVHSKWFISHCKVQATLRLLFKYTIQWKEEKNVTVRDMHAA